MLITIFLQSFLGVHSLSLQLRNDRSCGCFYWEDSDYEFDTNCNNAVKAGSSKIACYRHGYQQFFVPSSWIPGIYNSDPSKSESSQDYQFQIDGYVTNKIPSGIWNGQWETQTSDQCPTALLEGLLNICDESMALLLGSDTSIGELRNVSKEVNEKGPKYMPGNCCCKSSFS